MGTDAAQTLSFKVPRELAEETRNFAKADQKQVSEYIREAVREKNERMLAERMRFLSQRLAAENNEATQELDSAAGDGLD
jgi:predicted DNA-binding protein